VDAGSYPDSTYLRNENNGWEPFEIFNLVAPKPDGQYTIKNIILNNELRQAPSLLGFIKDDGQTDFETTRLLKELFDSQEHTLNPNVQTRVKLTAYYNAMISQVSNSASVSRAIAKNQELTVQEIEGAREQVLGVSSDEELSNMVMYQNAFNASSRYINVISEMLEHIINRLGNM
jgi:flagellar hook-associated protein 1 FlgK